MSFRHNLPQIYGILKAKLKSNVWVTAQMDECNKVQKVARICSVAEQVISATISIDVSCMAVKYII